MKTIQTSIFRHVNNYIVENMEREKCYHKWFSKCFEKIKRNVENKNSIDYSMTSEEIVVLQKRRCQKFCKIQESTCAKVTFLIKLQARPATLLKKRPWHRCFPVNFAKFLRTRFSHPLSHCFYS